MNNWIKVEDKLPEVYHGVLCWIEGEDDVKPGIYAIGYLNEGWYEWMSDESMSSFGYKVVAWQELPDEYLVKEE